MPLHVSSLGKGCVPSLKKHWNPFTQGCPVLSLVNIGEKVFKDFLTVSNSLLLYIPFKKGVPLHLNKHDIIHQRMLCAKFSWYWYSGPRRRSFRPDGQTAWRATHMLLHGVDVSGMMKYSQCWKTFFVTIAVSFNVNLCCVQQSEHPRTFADWTIENDVRDIV